MAPFAKIQSHEDWNFEPLHQRRQDHVNDSTSSRSLPPFGSLALQWPPCACNTEDGTRRSLYSSISVHQSFNFRKPRPSTPRVSLNTDNIVSTATTLAQTKSASLRPLAVPSDICTSRSAGHLQNVVIAVSNYQEYAQFFFAEHHAKRVAHIHNNRSQPFGPANTPPSPAHRRPSHVHTAARDAAIVYATGSFGLS